MSIFKRFSRGSRSNSYVDDGYESSPHSPSGPKSAFDRYVDNNAHNTSTGSRPGSRRQSQGQHNVHSAEQLGQQTSSPPDSAGNDVAMYQRGGHTQQPDPYAAQGSHSRVVSGSAPLNGTSSMGHSSLPDRSLDKTAPAMSSSGKFEPAPDMLTQAFNLALHPYNEKIEQQELEIQELRDFIATLENERKDMHAWIDKRGLRPDVPPSIAAAMDHAPSTSQQPGQAASTLAAQLDRKITIVNFDLHRLQDDLNDSISTSHFASSMLKFLPEITRLSSLPQGPRHAFDLILKLGGNLNSHGLGGDGAATGIDEAGETEARKEFFTRLDGKMVEVVEGRFREGEEWPVGKEIRRLEKTAAYLRNFGVEPYFPRTLELMRADMNGPGHGESSGSGHLNGASVAYA